MRPIIPIPACILAVVTILLAIILFGPARASDDTCRIQERLSERGYFTGEITCDPDDTEIAIRKFQIDNGLHVDGIAGEDTRRVLFADREKAAVIIERKAPAPMTEQEEFARCSEDVVSAEALKWRKGAALKEAVKNWRAQVLSRRDLGLEYMSWEDAADKKTDNCKEIAAWQVHCKIYARPCKSGN